MRKNVNLDKLNHIVDELADTVVRKNHDYGDAWQSWGIFTPLVRINDKLLRLQTLSSGERALVADERIEDTLRDVLGYALLALAWIEKQSAEPKPTQEAQMSLFTLIQANEDGITALGNASIADIYNAICHENDD